MDSQPVQVQLGDVQKLEVVPEQEREERDSGYEDFDALDNEPEDSDMEGSIMHRPRPKKAVKAPVVPQRSDKRASKLLESVLLELKTLDGTVPAKDAEQSSIVSDPHELYLSSEEDVSLSDYEDSDSLVDFEPSEADESQPASRASSRRSQEDTARAVSLTIITKPQIIQVNIPRPASQNRHSTTLENHTAPMTNTTTSYISTHNPRRSAPLTLYPTSHRLSLASTTSNPLTYHSNQSVNSSSPRKSSKLNLSTLVTSAKNSFLASDPFASPSQAQANENEELESPITPKTPTSMAAAAFKKSLSRSINKRNPSMSKLSRAYKEAANQRESMRLARELAQEESKALRERIVLQRAETMPATTDAGGSMRYKDIMKAAGEVVRSPTSPVRERERQRTMSMGHKVSLSVGLARRKSVKGRGDRYLA
ncbi:hypothetical protein D0Z07_7522 [Hyphodiscus hymeniophilus]|uniref:Uncharacterized protein n=1 Tax=Hyphodiscus hymeniophilus TaxID=353542 RepID=A0A9P6VF10_9HELO|nr:hypothetical protein D0Z07_7522 [Hyphodiscus hymeniophilus]